MAVWQYDCSLVPKLGVIRVHGCILPQLSDYRASDDDCSDSDSDINYWEEQPLDERVLAEVDLILPKTKSWSSDGRMYGSDDGNKIEIWDDDFVFRFDLRTPDLEILEMVLRLARKLDCTLVEIESGDVFDPEMPTVARRIRESSAFQFVKDPQAFLRGLK